MIIDKNTTLYSQEHFSSPFAYALKGLQRDMSRIFGQEPLRAKRIGPGQIRFQAAAFDHEEMFRIQSNEDHILIEGSDGLGIVFGIYHFCEHYLGVDPYEFWTDFPYEQREKLEIPPSVFTSSGPKVHLRGWFINDEDCLIGWHDEMEISLETWEQIFETILRAGYNMVIPGTGITTDGPQLQLASDMGLWIAQHHAEPLGASMFSDVYPDIKPRLPEEKERFIKLYKKAVEQNKDRKVVWTLGFRGQGDLPFFEDDTRYDTSEKRATLISDMIDLQKKLVLEMMDGPQHFVHYLYSESNELYRDGLLKLDDDIIRVWSDNGFGAMRMRREWGPERQISSMPLPEDKDRINGVYYHVSFHDLQVSNKLVPLVNPELIQDQLQKVYESGDIQYLLVNVSNIHPHVFNIELINKLCRFPMEDSGKEIVINHYYDWSHRHYPGFETQVQELMKRYYQAPFQYGNNRDDKVGEQVYHHTMRNCIIGVIKNESIIHLLQFIPEKMEDNTAGFQWLLEKAIESLPTWETLDAEAEALYLEMNGHAAQYFSDSIRMHINYSYYSCKGFVFGLKGLLAFSEQNYRAAFCFFNEGKSAMEDAWKNLKACEHGKWANFFRGEWLTDTRETIRYLETIRGLTKILGDTSHWRSEWTMVALELESRTIQTITQASLDYDQLADILYNTNDGICIEDEKSNSGHGMA